jgi:hypothetical protein
MTQVTLVSLWGEKQEGFADLVTQCQELVVRAVGAAFTAYDLRQIHATIISLASRSGSVHNANFAKYRARNVMMSFDGFLAYLRGCGHFPFEVQIGGFADRQYPFTSRNAVPYKRSFSIQGDKVVVMGWPVRGEPLSGSPATCSAGIQEARIYPQTLDLIRHAAQSFGILHGYHRTPSDVDNDLFFRIGLIDPKAMTPAVTSALENQVRQFLGAQRPLVVGISLDDTFIAAYEDDRLPLDSTRAYSLTDARVTGGFVAGLFR